MFIIYVQGVVGLDSLVRLLWKCSEDFSNLLIKNTKLPLLGPELMYLAIK